MSNRIPTKAPRWETIADYALVIVLGIAIAFGLYVYVSWFLVLTSWKIPNDYLQEIHCYQSPCYQNCSSYKEHVLC